MRQKRLSEKGVSSMKSASISWRNPEAGFKEVKASEKVADYLEREGFRVERGAGGVPTAIKASYGNGHPVIGFMGEFDALPGLSQKVLPRKKKFRNRHTVTDVDTTCSVRHM